MYTCWLPLSNLIQKLIYLCIFSKFLKENQGLQEGTICVCEESHLLGIENENIIANYELPESFLSI